MEQKNNGILPNQNLSKQGKLIVVEGASDGIGKTTQFEKLRDHLEQDGIEIATHHFPSYGTVEGALVESYLKGDFGDKSKLSPYFVNSLYAVDRGVTWNKELKKLFAEGKFILLDRYTTSSLIYQSAYITDPVEKKDFVDFVSDFEYNKIGIKRPDNVIFLHAPLELVNEMRRARKQNAGVQGDIHETDPEFMKLAYDSAVFLADYYNWDVVECSDGNKMRSIEDIHEDVYRLVKKR